MFIPRGQWDSFTVKQKDLSTWTENIFEAVKVDNGATKLK